MGLRSRGIVLCAIALVTGCAGAEVRGGRTQDQKPAPLTVAAPEQRDQPPSIEPAAPSAPALEMDAPRPSEPEAQPVMPRSEPAKRLARPAREKAGAPEDMASGGRAASGSAVGYGHGAAGLGVMGSIGVGGGGGGVMRRGGSPLTLVEQGDQGFNREGYAHVAESEFMSVRDQALSTFSVDVDTASYSNVRRFLRDGQLPPADAVRLEELVNYFDYDYPAPEGGRPFSIYSEVSDCPWNDAHRLVHIGIQGRKLDAERVPPRNLVFLIDVSGSMEDPSKLPLLRRGMAMLVRDLRPQDRVSMVVYAGASGLVLPSTSGAHKADVLAALERLSAGGSTNGAAGIELAYQEAAKNFIPEGINRVILATDGDFNVGPSSEGELVRIIEEKRKAGVFLTVLGFGRGNLQDSRMEQLADKGNGNYAYIDTIDEAHKVLVREAGATLVTIAKDVKLQVEFNPAHVASYRLIGYENRTLAARDFNDDTKDAGEIGAGHTVTALYEIVPAGSDEPSAREAVDPLRYQAAGGDTQAAESGELLTVKVRYKAPSADQSQLIQLSLQDHHRALSDASNNFRFSAGVASFGMLLRGSKNKGGASLKQVERLVGSALGADPHGEKAELLDMVHAAKRLGLGS